MPAKENKRRKKKKPEKVTDKGARRTEQRHAGGASGGISISDVHTVQVSPSFNYFVTQDSDHSGKHEAEKKLQKSNMAQGLLVLKNILKNRRGKATLKDVESDVNDILSKGGTQSFKELYGVPLHRFIKNNLGEFHIYSENDTCFVELVDQESKTHTNTEILTDTSLDEFDSFVDDAASESTFYDCESDTQDYQDDDITEETKTQYAGPDEWQVVSRKNVTHEKLSTETKIKLKTKPLAREVLTHKDDVNALYLKQLLSKPEDQDLKFIPDHNTYTSNVLRCQHDIVCMWNTPHRIVSHIVIGVSVVSRNGKNIAEPMGTDPGFDDTFFDKESLFKSCVFSSVPKYEYKRVEYDTMTFGVIVVACSCKQGQPSVVIENKWTPETEVSKDQLWYRNGPNNTICPTSDLKTALIYQWFFGGIESALLPVEDNVPSANYIAEPVQVEQISIKETDVESEFTSFYKRCSQFKKSHFVMIAGNVSNKIKNLDNFALIPLLAVYDFDINSCSKGLFNAVQDSAEKHRQVRIGTWREPAQALSENSTYWCFLRGRREVASTRTDSIDCTKEAFETQLEWFSQAKPGVLDNCQQLFEFTEGYTVLTLLVLWPEEERLIPYIKKFLDRLVETLSCIPNIVICMHQGTRTDTEEMQLKALVHEYGESNVHLCRLDFSQLCMGIGSKMSKEGGASLQFMLPKADNDCLPDCISNKDAMWLKEDLEVLYLKNPYTVKEEEELKEENNKFYKGGNLSWFAWYQNGDNCMDINRDILKETEARIESHLEERRPPVITILHAPGSGGTTLAQRILWNFHTKVPCAFAKAGTIVKSKDLPAKLQLLYDKTQLTTLLLVDGEDEARIRSLQNSIKHAIILFVKRYPFRMKEPSLTSQYKPHQKNTRPNQKTDSQQSLEKNKVYLKGHVSFQEANMLASKFGERCDKEAQRQQLQKLKNEVRHEKRHNMYEFGMTVYSHEFKGIVSYVRGYLQLSRRQNEALLPWQRCLGYMSLVYYYGQTSVPCQFFARLFGKPPNYKMSLEDDFPYPSSQFIVYDTNERKEMTLRICHYEIAKEILEQILTCKRDNVHNRTENLGKSACQNLPEFAGEFIDYCSSKGKRYTGISNDVRHMLTKTFIYREGFDIEENADQNRKRPQVSQLLLDILSSPPLFSERLQVLEHLSSAFPDDPNFQAHVGRFHAFCGPDNVNKAEKCFKRSISLCEARQKGKDFEDMDESTKRTLVHVYHMYGVLKKKQIGAITSSSQKGTCKRPDSNEDFGTQLLNLVLLAEKACGFFERSRTLTPDTLETFTDAYICDIRVRLQVCDYVMQYFKPQSDDNNVFSQFLTSTVSDDCKIFVEESIPAISTLLMECCQDVDLDPSDLRQLRKLGNWFQSLFGHQNLPEDTVISDDDIGKRRLKITSLKLDHSGNNPLDGIDNVLDREAVHEVIKLYEENFREIHNTGLGDHLGKKELDNDYLEWICAIRHCLCGITYELKDVLEHVTRWHYLTKSPMSTFYLFVIKSVLGFGISSEGGDTEKLLEAKMLKKELAKKAAFVPRPKYPREWLGASGPGIQTIKSGIRRIHQQETRDHSRVGSGLDLAVCKGTIMPPNNKDHYGHITLDIRVAEVKVYFIPFKASLQGSRHGGQRVEFNLAFTVENGYEAFNVKLIKRHGCSNCSAKVEFTSADNALQCTNCGEEIEKDDLNLINDVESD